MGEGRVMAEGASRCVGTGLRVASEPQQWGRMHWPPSLRLLEVAATQHMHRVEVRSYGEKRNQRYSYSFDMNRVVVAVGGRLGEGARWGSEIKKSILFILGLIFVLDM